MTWNGVIIFPVCSRQHLRTKTNAFVVSLAVADFFVGANVIPSMFFFERTGRNYSLYRGLVVIKWLFLDASVMNMCSLVLDRYLAVVKPFKYLTLMTSERVILLSSSSWGVSIAFINSNPDHMLHHFLPPLNYCHYNLRRQRHFTNWVIRTKRLSSTFLPSMCRR